jgi:hypothetical protein
MSIVFTSITGMISTIMKKNYFVTVVRNCIPRNPQILRGFQVAGLPKVNVTFPSSLLTWMKYFFLLELIH